jgi:hypothetical protein
VGRGWRTSAAECRASGPSGAPTRSDLVGDPRGDGCPVAVSWAGDVAEADVDGSGSPARFRLGRPGDVLLLGDWSCGGRDVPALYRPGTGEVFLFSGWAGPGREMAADRTLRSGVLNGTARRVRATGGCDQVVVDRAGVGKHMRPRQSG